MIEGVIFDFNGTLFWDSLLHDKAWEAFTRKNNLRIPTTLEMRNHIHGKGTQDIMNYVFGEVLSPYNVHQRTQEKEQIYRDLVLSDAVYKNLAPGANELLDYLKDKKFPITIATSSEGTNVDFFFEHFELATWFEREKTVYDNGQFKLKPEPDIFIMAAERIGVPISKCLILEDSPSGIQAAKSAGAAKIIFVENNSPIDFNDIKHLVDAKVNSLDEVIAFL